MCWSLVGAGAWEEAARQGFIRSKSTACAGTRDGEGAWKGARAWEGARYMGGRSLGGYKSLRGGRILGWSRRLGVDSSTGAWDGQEPEMRQESGMVQEPRRGRGLGGCNGRVQEHEGRGLGWEGTAQHGSGIGQKPGRKHVRGRGQVHTESICDNIPIISCLNGKNGQT